MRCSGSKLSDLADCGWLCFNTPWLHQFNLMQLYLLADRPSTKNGCTGEDTAMHKSTDVEEFATIFSSSVDKARLNILSALLKGD